MLKLQKALAHAPLSQLVGAHRKSGAGFTLVELIIVIAIIGVLATAILIAVAGNRPKAVDASVKSAMAQVQKEIVRCVADGKRVGLTNNITPAAGTGTCFTDRAKTTKAPGYMDFPNIANMGDGTCDNAWGYYQTAAAGAYPTKTFNPTTGGFQFNARCQKIAGTTTGSYFKCTEQGCTLTPY